MRPSLAARATASIRSSRSSKGVRFQRLHRGQTTQSLPFHSSKAIRRPTPSPEGPPSPSSDALQKAHVRNTAAKWLSKASHVERCNVHVGRSGGDEIRNNLACQDGEEHTVATMPSRIP